MKASESQWKVTLSCSLIQWRTLQLVGKHQYIHTHIQNGTQRQQNKLMKNGNYIVHSVLTPEHTCTPSPVFQIYQKYVSKKQMSKYVLFTSANTRNHLQRGHPEYSVRVNCSLFVAIRPVKYSAFQTSCPTTRGTRPARSLASQDPCTVCPLTYLAPAPLLPHCPSMEADTATTSPTPRRK